MVDLLCDVTVSKVYNYFYGLLSQATKSACYIGRHLREHGVIAPKAAALTSSFSFDITASAHARNCSPHPAAVGCDDLATRRGLCVQIKLRHVCNYMGVAHVQEYVMFK